MNFLSRQQVSQKVSNRISKALLAAAKVAAVGTISASVIGIGASINPAFALTTEQVSSKLSGVPVYVLSSNNGLVLISANSEGEEATQPSLFVFMTEQDANGFLAKANENNPTFAPDAQVTVTNLGNLYKESQERGEQPLRLSYFPEATEVSQASSLNTEYKGGVPLFYAQFEDGSLFPVDNGSGEAIYPLFFSSTDLQAQLDNLAQRDPEARATISIGVLPLEIMLQEMQNEDYETLQRIQLLPDSDTINTIRQSAPSQGQ